MLHQYELTVKHVAPNGEISIWATSKVRQGKGFIEFPNRADGMVVTLLNDGTVYVMNSQGKTIHNHDFSGPSHE